MQLELVIGGVIALGVGVAILYGGFARWQQYRLIQDTPTETVRAAAAGRTELAGVAEPIESAGTLERPFSGGDCLVAEYEIEEYEHDDDGSDWRTLDSGTRLVPFAVDDDTGRMRVEPAPDATYEFKDQHISRRVIGSDEQTPAAVARFLREHTTIDVQQSGGVSGMLFGERRRYTQRVLPPGSEVYLLGGAEPAEDATGTDADRLVLRSDDASDAFIIATKDESEVVSSYRWQAPVLLFLGLAFGAVGVYLLVTELGVA
jgi:hypothetical protein